MPGGLHADSGHLPDTLTGGGVGGVAGVVVFFYADGQFVTVAYILILILTLVIFV